MYIAIPGGEEQPRIFRDAKRAAVWLSQTSLAVGHVFACDRLELDPVDFKGQGIRQTYENFRHGLADEEQPPGYLHAG